MGSHPPSLLLEHFYHPGKFPHTRIPKTVQYFEIFASDDFPQTKSSVEPQRAQQTPHLHATPPTPQEKACTPTSGSTSAATQVTPHQSTQRLLGRAVPFCSQRVWIREGRVFPMNHNHSWSRPSPLPSPGSHFLICKTRSHGPDPLAEPADLAQRGGGGRQRPLVARA